MLKNALVFRLESWQPPALADLQARLDAARFAECGPTQAASLGWVAPRGREHGALVESVGGQWLLKLCGETKAVPGPVVKRQLDERLDRIEADTGRRPKGKAAKEVKEEIVHDLLPRAFAKRWTAWVWIDPKAGRVVADATGGGKADAIGTLLMDALGGQAVLAPVQSALAPATAMARWLAEKDAPAGFSLDRDCTLTQPDGEKASVRYARHALDIDEIAAHLAQGKVPVQLAMTWAGRVSFVLTDTLSIRRIKLLDVALEGADASSGPDDDDHSFDADAALATGELGRLIPDLLDALGGEADRAAARSSSSSAAPAAASPEGQSQPLTALAA